MLRGHGMRGDIRAHSLDKTRPGAGSRVSTRGRVDSSLLLSPVNLRSVRDPFIGLPVLFMYFCAIRGPACC
jgi:hypothetical protein